MPARDKLAQLRAQSISAALRHIRDAEHLAQAGPAQSLDQAFHLAGLAPECARKACLSERWADKAIGHGFGATPESILNAVLSIDVHAHRYQPTDWHIRYPALVAWSVESRYWATGTAEHQATGALLQAAREVVDEVVLAMWSDGVLSSEGLR